MRPSELCFIHDEVTAWCFDRAVHFFGSHVDADLKQATSGAKKDSEARQKYQRTLAKWLGTQQQFRDPAAGSSSGDIVSKPGVQASI